MPLTPEEANQIRQDTAATKAGLSALTVSIDNCIKSTETCMKAVEINSAANTKVADNLGYLLLEFKEASVREEFRDKTITDMAGNIQTIADRVSHNADEIHAKHDSFVEDYVPTLQRIQKTHERQDKMWEAIWSKAGLIAAMALVVGFLALIGVDISKFIK